MSKFDTPNCKQEISEIFSITYLFLPTHFQRFYIVPPPPPLLLLAQAWNFCRPDSIWELDLSLQLFQFFFTGMKNQSRFDRKRRRHNSIFPINSPQNILAWQGWHLLFWNAEKLFKDHKRHQFHRVPGEEEERGEQEHSSFPHGRRIHCSSWDSPRYLLNFFL